MRRAAVALAALAIAGSAQAASIGIISFAGSTPIISLAGPITPGDDVKFHDFAQALRYPAIVRLSSYGGNTLAALTIGREIARLGYTTAVDAGEICASACGLIWLAGRARISAPTARIGLHATYLEQNGKTEQSSGGNALVGKYLGELGYQDDFVVYATSAAPADMAWLNRTVTDHFNIAWEMRDQDVATLSTLDIPAQNPAPSTLQPVGPIPIQPPKPTSATETASQSAVAVPTHKPPPHPPKVVERSRTLQDDVTDFFFGQSTTEQHPLARRASVHATGAAPPAE